MSPPAALELRSNQLLDDALSLVEGLSSTARLLAGILVRHLGRENGQCNPSVGRLAEKLARSERTIRRALSELVGAGVIAPDLERGGARRGGRSPDGRANTTWWLFPRAQELLERGLAWREERRAARGRAAPETAQAAPTATTVKTAPPTICQNRAPAREADPQGPTTTAAPATDIEAARAAWSAAWQERYGAPYRWPGLLDRSGRRAHDQALSALVGEAEGDGEIEATIGAYLDAETAPPPRGRGPYSVWPHDLPPSPPKLARALSDWLKGAAVAGARGPGGAPSPGPTSTGAWPPWIARLSDGERARLWRAVGAEWAALSVGVRESLDAAAVTALLGS